MSIDFMELDGKRILGFDGRGRPIYPGDCINQDPSAFIPKPTTISGAMSKHERENLDRQFKAWAMEKLLPRKLVMEALRSAQCTKQTADLELRPNYITLTDKPFDLMCKIIGRPEVITIPRGV